MNNQELLKSREKSTEVAPGIELNNPFFAEAVKKIIEEKEIEEIIETGTYQGTGSTLVFAKTGLPVKTIEVRRDFYETSKQNLQKYKNVELFNALSLRLDDMIEFIQENGSFYRAAMANIIPIGCEGGHSGDPVEFYTNEVMGFEGDETRTKVENLLPGFINNNKKQIIYLDSAGGVGWLEYQQVINLQEEYLKNKVLLFDDVNHVKHYNTAKDLEERKLKLVRVEDHRSAYCDFIEHYEQS